MTVLRLTVQRVRSLAVLADGEFRGEFDRGLLVFFGVGQAPAGVDTSLSEASRSHSLDKSIEKAALKILSLRTFPSEADETAESDGASSPMHSSVLDIGGGLALISQFTLWADLRKGNRPGFGRAIEPHLARQIYLRFVEEVEKRAGVEVPVVTGIFGSDMQITATQDGPVTFVFDVQDGKILDL